MLGRTSQLAPLRPPPGTELRRLLGQDDRYVLEPVGQGHGRPDEHGFAEDAVAALTALTNRWPSRPAGRSGVTSAAARCAYGAPPTTVHASRPVSLGVPIATTTSSAVADLRAETRYIITTFSALDHVHIGTSRCSSTRRSGAGTCVDQAAVLGRGSGLSLMPVSAAGT